MLKPQDVQLLLLCLEETPFMFDFLAEFVAEDLVNRGLFDEDSGCITAAGKQLIH
jgi:hypothetical protein